MHRSLSPKDLFSDTLRTPIGTLLVVFDEAERLRALDWADYEDRMLRLLRLHYGTPENGYRLRVQPLALSIREPLQAYFDGGTPFARSVWQALRAIPAGKTISYGALAAEIGRPSAIRAVGRANGANPVGIVVPCHRVIGASRTLTGYAGGLERKGWLLAHEGVLLSGVPDTVHVRSRSSAPYSRSI